MGSQIDEARMGGEHRLLLLCSLVGLARSQGTPGCWYEAMCQAIDNNNIHEEQVIPSENPADLESQMQWCYEQCQNVTECTDFTVYKTARFDTCYLLTNCDEKSTESGCLSQELCNSGPSDCDSANNDMCPILDPPPNATIPWQCDHGVDPYSQQVPEETECFIGCNAWLDKNGNQAKIASKCMGGQWQDSEIQPFGIDPTEIAALPSAPYPKPDAPDGDQVGCGCDTIDMAWVNSQTNDTIDYDPNTLPGTDFLCSGANYITDDGTDLKFILRPEMTCRLFCDNYHIATMTCLSGLWTGEPELGAWCYAEPTVEDDMGVGTTVPPGN